MKRSKEEANRWLEQAKYDFESAKRMYEQKILEMVKNRLTEREK